MRTNNDKVKNVIISLYFILVVLAIIISTLVSSFSDLTDSPAMTIAIILVIFAVLFIITHRVSKYFEYDSDGVQVVILNRGLLLADYFNYREHKLEFEKGKLRSFKFRNFYFYKSLLVYLEDSHGNISKTSFNVTLLSRKKRKYIRQSMSKIVKSNRKIRNQE
jgi:hypothetical protein